MIRFVLGACLLLSACAAAPEPGGAADTPSPVRVFTNATIYTGLYDEMTHEPVVAGAVIVGADGRILATAPPASMDWDETEVEIIDLGGAFLYPGFTDAHAHLRGIGQREITLNLDAVRSIAALAAVTEAELAGKPPGSVLEGRGWIETGWPEERMPVAADLDAVSGDHKVIYIRADGHAPVANSAALAAAGITAATPDPPGGKIERDADGEPTGFLIDTAMALVAPLLAEPDEAMITEALARGAAVYAARGWTGLHNMSVPGEEAPLMARLAAEGRLPLRIYNAFDEAAFALAAARRFETDTLTNRAVKVYMDGALGSRGALLIAPYADRPDSTGLALMQPDALAELMDRAEASGVQLAIHAIGDLANRRIIDAMQEGGYGPGLRWRIEHAQVIHPDDLPRLAGAGLIASMQPSHAIGDLHFAPARLGLQRLRGAYAWASLADLGTVVAGGSDAPVEAGSPMIEFYAAIARRDLSGFSGEGWHPEEALSRQQALALFTTGPAWASFQEDDLGTIEPGKRADFSAFDRDIMTAEPEAIPGVRAVMTVVGGEIVWRAD